MLQMNAVHTIHTPRSGNAGGFQSQGAVPLFDLPYIPIDGGIGDAGHSQVAQNIFLPPEGKGLAEGAPAFIAVAAKFKVRLLPQLALTGQHSRNGMPPGLPLKLVQRGLFHVVTAPGRDRKGGVQKIFILLTVVNRLLSVLVQRFSVQAGQTVMCIVLYNGSQSPLPNRCLCGNSRVFVPSYRKHPQSDFQKSRLYSHKDFLAGCRTVCHPPAY